MEPKKCKGTGVALGYGCGSMEVFRRFGLGIKCGCYRNWLLNTDAGNIEIKKSVIRSNKKLEKQAKKKNLDERRELNALGRCDQPKQQAFI